MMVMNEAQLLVPTEYFVAEGLTLHKSFFGSFSSMMPFARALDS